MGLCGRAELFKQLWLFWVTWTLLCHMKVRCQIQHIKNPVYWDAWSDWSACSVTCGQGVATRSRRCLTWHLGTVEPAEIWQCQGRDTRRKLCLTKECDSDLWELGQDECLKLQTFNKFGQKQFWRSYEDTQCKLVCQEVRGREIRTLNVAKDGTACSLPNAKTAHCQRGFCKPTTNACDGGKGKQLRLDMCLICGGDNSSCYLVQGTFKDSASSMARNGLSIVVRVPQGSTFINVVKNGGAQNTLGLLNSDDIFVINTDDQPSHPGKYRAEGATWMYESDWHKESFTATGPTVGSVTVLLTLRDRNQHVTYSFWAPKTFAPIRSHGNTDETQHRKNDKRERTTQVPVLGNSRTMGFLESRLPTDQHSLNEDEIWDFLDSEIKSTPLETGSNPSFVDPYDKTDTGATNSDPYLNSNFPERHEDNWSGKRRSDRLEHNINTDSVIFLTSSDNSFPEPDIFKPDSSKSTQSNSGSFAVDENIFDLPPGRPKDDQRVIPGFVGNLTPDIDVTGVSSERNSRQFSNTYHGHQRRDYYNSKHLSDNLIKETSHGDLGSPEWSGQGNSITRPSSVDRSVETNSITRLAGEKPGHSKGDADKPLIPKQDVNSNISNVSHRKFSTSSTSKNTSKERGDKLKKKKKKKKKKRRKKWQRKALSLNPSEHCFPCPRANDRAEQFCGSDFVSKVYINRRKVVENETRYDVTVMSSYRNRVSLMPREFIWVESTCKCPNLRAKRTYILMGRMVSYTDREARLVIGPGSYIRGFSLGQERKLRRLGMTMKCGG